MSSLPDRSAGAASLAARDQAVVWHPYAPMPLAEPAVVVSAAEGVHLELGDGRRVVDGMSSWWAAVHGYRHPVLDAAVRDQLDRMAHVMFGGLTHAPAVELAELLVEISPAGLAHVFFCDSGSVAVEVAVKMALQHWLGRGRPERRRLLTVRGGYHGDTLAAMSVCDPVTGMHHLFAHALPQQLFAPVPSPVYGAAFDDEHLGAIRGLLRSHAHEVAAVVLEPIVQGAGGMRFYAPEYLRGVRALCDEFDVLLVADEIATGFGRSGALFGCDHAGVAPDILCLGKALTGGYVSMAATLCTTDVARAVSAAEGGALMHGPTFMANPLGCAVSLASVRLLRTRPWLDDVRRIEAGLVRGIEPLRGHDAVADVRVLGAIGVVELHRPVDMANATRAALDAGAWLRPFGRLVYAMPPYISTDDDLAVVTGAMRAVVEACR
jgi:adenosylmethionine-8-amino-7-oxononanoate aminotransferase